MKILHEMDVVFSEVINEELKDFRERQQEQQRREIERSKGKGRK